jgi:hypothetical protein
MQVRVALAAADDFKVGDWAQVFHDGQWIAVTIASPLDSGEYKVNFLLTVIPVKANSSEIRHYTPTAAERQAAIDLRLARERLDASAAEVEKFLATQETGPADPFIGGTVGPKAISAGASTADISAAPPTDKQNLEVRNPAAAQTSGGNPLIGNWTLADTDKNYCATHEEFRKDSVIEVKSGKTTSYRALYLIKPNYVDVAVNGDLAHYGQWDETAPDEITYRINSLYVVASCRYHRD